MINEIYAKVVRIITKDNLSFIKFESFEKEFSMLSLSVSLDINDEVIISFKPSSVAIAKGSLGLLSYSNQIKTNISNLEIGEILTSIKANFYDFKLESLISTNSAKRLNLELNDEITMLVKATDVFVKEKLNA